MSELALSLGITLGIMEFLGNLALNLTGEISVPVIGLWYFCFLVTRLGQKPIYDYLKLPRPNEKPLAAVLSVIILSSIVIWRIFRLPAPLTAAHGVLFVQIFLMLTPATTLRGWRIALGLVSLILASVMSPEAYIGIFIVAFMLISTIAISLLYLESELKRRNAINGKILLPPRFIRNMLGTSVLILLTSSVIFPILPRTKTDAHTDTARVGYTEEVSLSDWTKLSGENSGAPLMWLYTDEDIELADDITLGLIRGRVLDLFDGNSWSPSLMRRDKQPPESKPANGQRIIKIDAVRNPMGTNIVPIPYGTSSVHYKLSDGNLELEATKYGERVDRMNSDRKIKFEIEFSPFGFNQKDQPSAMHLSVPPSIKTERMMRLVRRIGASGRSSREIAQRLMSWFKSEGYKASLDGAPEALSKAQAEKIGLHPLEQFLFISKEGHCEWFASAFAVIMRLYGVPTRLVAGFRLGSRDHGKTVTLRSGDAHAWVEVWTEDRGWVPFDPTPKVPRVASLGQQIREAYQLFSGYWFRYILVFDEHRDAVKDLRDRRRLGSNRFKSAFDDFFETYKIHIFVLSGLIGFWLIRKWLERKNRLKTLNGPDALGPYRVPSWLNKERSRFEKSKISDPVLRTEWHSVYQRARFGRQDFDTKAVQSRLSSVYRYLNR